MSAFTLVELLVVIAIIGMMVGLSAMAVSGMRAPAVQHAADQVMSGLSLARQIAITKNTKAALLIADKTSTGFPTNGPYRHWSVVYSNKGNSTWTIAKDWEELPNGAFFLETLGTSYKTISNNIIAQKVGESFTPSTFEDKTTYSISSPTNLSLSSVPSIFFQSDGTSTGLKKAIRIAAGSVIGGNATLTGNATYYFVETDGSVGRIRMRSPESYK
jgi:prepilin-type N-terminal cleavage/methylation domain-containing protein